MRAVIQRVTQASVEVAGETVGEISLGLVALIGVAHQDGEPDVKYLADKIAGLRVFEDAAGLMNRSVLDVGGSLLVISQFTLFGDVRRGKRPSFTDAAPPEQANALYEALCARLADLGLDVQRGRFQADMRVSLVNQGPVTILLDSRKLF